MVVPEDRLDFFRARDHALDFALPGWRTTAADIFFLLHPVAKEPTAAVDDITAAPIAREAELADRAVIVLAGRLRGAGGDHRRDLRRGGRQPFQEALDVLAARPPRRPGERRVTADPGSHSAAYAGSGLRPVRGEAQPGPVEVDGLPDQDLVGKFPEPLALPPGSTGSTRAERADGNVYLFREGDNFWSTRGHVRAGRPDAEAADQLSPRFTELTGVDAAFTAPRPAPSGRGPRRRGWLTRLRQGAGQHPVPAQGAGLGEGAQQLRRPGAG